jgi:hypothetical protein
VGEMNAKFWLKNLNERDHFGDLEIDGGVLLEK